jgi:cell division protein FtsZ
VVATGIDQALTQRPSVSAAEARIAEVAQRLRADNERLAERVDRSEPMRSTAAAPVSESIESAKAAVAAAILPQATGQEVTIRPLGPKPSLFIDPAANGPEPEEPDAFIPPAPERVPSRAMRMPRIDELPIPAQNEIRAQRGELPPEQHPEKRRMSLLQRLASVGLGRHDEEEEPPPPPGVRRTPGGPLPGTERPPGRPSPRLDSRQEPVSEYAKRSSPQGLDQHGRQAPVHNRSEEDQLDIPAFLRRQAN